MKTKTWILLFSFLAFLCAVLSFIFFLGSEECDTVQVYSDGELVLTLNLAEDGEYRIGLGEEWNVINVKDGKVFVSSASCSSQDCVRHYPADHGAPIVCLPNRLVIEFAEGEEYDAVLR